MFDEVIDRMVSALEYADLLKMSDVFKAHNVLHNVWGHQIAHVWSIHDVLQVRPDLDFEKQCMVLEKVERQLESLDSQLGTKFYELRRIARELFGPPPAEDRSKFTGVAVEFLREGIILGNADQRTNGEWAVSSGPDDPGRVVSSLSDALDYVIEIEDEAHEGAREWTRATDARPLTS